MAYPARTSYADQETSEFAALLFLNREYFLALGVTGNQNKKAIYVCERRAFRSDEKKFRHRCNIDTDTVTLTAFPENCAVAMSDGRTAAENGTEAVGAYLNNDPQYRKNIVTNAKTMGLMPSDLLRHRSIASRSASAEYCADVVANAQMLCIDPSYLIRYTSVAQRMDLIRSRTLL